MEISFKIPTKQDILAKGIHIKVARERETFLKSQLGEFANKSGLYIQHSGGEIIYVGISCKGGKWGNFAERLRREFQTSSSQNSHLHQLLCAQENPIKVTFYSFEAIERMVKSKDTQLTPDRKTMILEQILIGIYNPKANRK